MVEVGQLSIMGSVNTTEITQGFNTIKNDFSNLENQSNQTNASLNRMNDITKGILNKFMLFGTIAVGSMTALASKSPVLAGTFARMEQEIFKISNTLGRQLKPAFDSFVGVLGSVNSFLVDNNALIKSLGGISSEVFTDISKIISGGWTKIQNIIPKSAGAIAGIKLGARFGLKGMLIGAALGYIAGDLAGGDQPEDPKFEKIYGPYAKTGEVFENMVDRYSSYNEEGGLKKFGTDLVTARFSRDTVNLLSKSLFDGLNWIFTSLTNKEKEMANTDGVPRD